MSQVSILISSFDGYSDCWLPVCHGITKYWPDRPYPVHLMTNLKDFAHPGIQVLKVGPDRGWSQRMLTALDRLQTPYVMYFQEDYWIMAPVDTARVQEYVGLMERKGLHYIRLLAKPQPDRDFPDDPRLGIIDAAKGTYRTSVQISLWRREVLRDLLSPEENVWQFELNATERSRRYGDTFLSIKKHEGDDFHWGIRYLCTAVNAGRWFRAAKVYAQQEGLEVDFSRLPMESWWDDFKRSGRLGAAAGLLAHRVGLALRDPARALGRVGRRLARGSK